jgi:outer membrane protein TolC
MLKAGVLFLMILFNLGSADTLYAQQTEVLSIDSLLAAIQQNLPRLQSYREQMSAGSQQIKLAQNTLMPDLTVGYQANYGTDNNISGMSYPGLLLPISGPVTKDNNYQLAAGTALSALLKWSPFTFGQRNALVETAKSQFQLANSQYNEQLFISQYTAVNTYLELLYLSKALLSMQENIQRNRINLQQAVTLGRTGLRPGSDSVQFQSALAQAQMDFLQSEKVYRQQQIALLQQAALPLSNNNLRLTDSVLLKKLPAIQDTTNNLSHHPVYQFYNAQKQVSAAELKQVKRSWMPELGFWGTAYSRGSDIGYDGTMKSSGGWNLSRNNFGFGVQLSLPILDFARWGIQKQQYTHLLNVREHLLKQTTLDLSAQLQSATVALQQNIRIAMQAPERLSAAQLAYQSLESNYKAGLIDYTRLAQGQYDLLTAEIEVYSSYVQAWQALLNLAVAEGGLSIFTNQL